MNCMPDYCTIVGGECLVINFHVILNIKFFDTIILYTHIYILHVQCIGADILPPHLKAKIKNL